MGGFFDAGSEPASALAQRPSFRSARTWGANPKSIPACAEMGGRLPERGLQARILRVGDCSPEGNRPVPLVRPVLHHRAARHEHSPSRPSVKHWRQRVERWKTFRLLTLPTAALPRMPRTPEAAPRRASRDSSAHQPFNSFSLAASALAEGDEDSHSFLPCASSTIRPGARLPME